MMMLVFVGQVFPYLAAGVFILGMLWRICSWLKCSVPFPLTMFPAPDSSVGRAAAIAKEMVLFDSLRRSDKSLWLWAWLLHIGLASIIGGHLVGISQLGQQFTAFGVSASCSMELSAMLGTTAGMAVLLALTVLLYRRTALPELKRLSSPADYFDLLLLLGVVISGLHMRITTLEADLPAIRAYMAGLMMLKPIAIPNSMIFVSHYFLVNVLLIYLPFSKMIHAAGFFATRALVVAPPPVYPTIGGLAQNNAVFSERRAEK